MMLNGVIDFNGGFIWEKIFGLISMNQNYDKRFVLTLKNCSRCIYYFCYVEN